MRLYPSRRAAELIRAMLISNTVDNADDAIRQKPSPTYSTSTLVSRDVNFSSRPLTKQKLPSGQGDSSPLVQSVLGLTVSAKAKVRRRVDHAFRPPQQGDRMAAITDLRLTSLTSNNATRVRPRVIDYDTSIDRPVRDRIAEHR